MPIMMTVCGLATIAGAGYIGALSFEALASDSRNKLASWSFVGADLLGVVASFCAIMSGLYSIVCAWLP